MIFNRFKINYYCNINVNKSVESYFFTSYNLKLFFLSNTNINHQKLLFIEPFKIKNIFFTISPIWKRYLAIHSPNTKLIVIGFRDFQSRNYIDLLNLPKDFEAYMQNALPVSEVWKIPIDGADMLDYLKRFFEGHGGNSVLSKLNSLRQTFNIAYTGLADGSLGLNEILNELILPLGKSEWETLLNRWENYYPYFEYLPFKSTMEKVGKTLKEIERFFSYENITEKLFLEYKINDKLNAVYNDLHKIDRLYIRPEIYGSR